jgi:hypothetical protein
MEKPSEHLTNPPRLLLDMRLAYETPPEPNEPPGLKVQRQLMKDKSNDFMDRMTTLEKAWAAQETAAIQANAGRDEQEKAAALPEPAEEVDEGSLKALEAIEELQALWREEQRQEDAELAARPNAAEFAGTLQRRLTEALRREQILFERVEELERDGKPAIIRNNRA